MRIGDKTPMRQKLSGISVLLTLIAAPAGMYAQSVYANNATGGTPYIYVMNPSTFAVTDTLTNLSSINGRGVVVVGGIVYYTSATSPNVFKYTLSSHTNNGVAFTVAGASALSTMAYDGANFWIGDYSGTNKAYLYTPTGTLLKTVNLANCGGSCDGLEYFLRNGNTPSLISNRGDADGPYDVYDTNGTLITPAFITPPSGSATGIAYDGTNFLVVSNFGSIGKFNGSTGALISTTSVTGFPSGFSPLIEDLSADYSIVLGTTTPAPSSFVLIGIGFAALMLWHFRSRIRGAFARS